MALPRSLAIGGFTWRIVRREMDDDTEGSTTWPECVIRIDTKQTARQQELALMHEMVHAAFMAAGISSKLTLPDEEMLVSCLDNHVFPYLHLTGKKRTK